MLMLASASRARHYLLDQVGISHCVMNSGVNEAGFEHFDPSTLVKSLSLAKARAVAAKLLNQGLDNSLDQEIKAVLGCDSVFVFQNEIFGKPRDSQQAIDRWERMSLNSGFLMTGHSLLFRSCALEGKRALIFNGLLQDVITTRVEFTALTRVDIENYVSTGEPFQCAGGFALEGKGGMFISKIDGCYSNVIGLSLPWLRNAFQKAGLCY